jgi:group I intron endonuclease
MKDSAIYAIVNRRTGDAYIGSTYRPGYRWKEHQRQLKKGAHVCSALQEAWNALGSDAFEFVIIWLVIDATVDAKRQTELFWINKAGTYNAMQANLDAGKFVMPEPSREILADRNRSRARLPEYRQSMSKTTQLRWDDLLERSKLMNAPKRGKHHVKGMKSVKSPEQWVEHSEKMKAVWADPERRQKLEARRAARWADPEAKARQGERMRAYHAARRAGLAKV